MNRHIKGSRWRAAQRGRSNGRTCHRGRGDLWCRRIRDFVFSILFVKDRTLNRRMRIIFKFNISDTTFVVRIGGCRPLGDPRLFKGVRECVFIQCIQSPRTRQCNSSMVRMGRILRMLRMNRIKITRVYRVVRRARMCIRSVREVNREIPGRD